MSNAQKHEASFVRVIKVRILASTKRVTELALNTLKATWKAVVGVFKGAAHTVGMASIATEKALEWTADLAKMAIKFVGTLMHAVVENRISLANVAVSLTHKLIWAVLLIARTPSMLIYGNDVAKTDWGIWRASWRLRNFDLTSSSAILRNELDKSSISLADQMINSEIDASVVRHPAQGKNRPTPKQRKTRPARLRFA